jgi:fumarate hydratase class II
MDELIATLQRLEAENEGVVKTGARICRTPAIAFSQEISGWRNMLEKTKAQLTLSLDGLKELALGAPRSAGPQLPQGFAEEVAAVVSELTGRNLRPQKTNSTRSRARTTSCSRTAL